MEVNFVGFLVKRWIKLIPRKCELLPFKTCMYSITKNY